MSDARPIFVIGPGRSGTTLLRYLLNSHPSIACPPEWPFLQPLLAAAEFFTGREGESAMNAEEADAYLEKRFDINVGAREMLRNFRGFFESFYRNYAERQAKPRWADKTHEFERHIFTIDALFERECRFILMCRHGLDVVLSAQERWGRGSGPEFLKNMAEYWCGTTRLHLKFYERNGDRCHRVRYEDLVRTPVPVTDAIFDFLGETRVPGIHETMFLRKHGGTAGDNKILNRTGIVTDSVFRWKNCDTGVYRPLLKEVPGFNDLLVQLGYDPVT